MSEANVLVLGAYNVGKTHYAGQLLGRLRYNRTGELKLCPGGTDDLNKLDEVLECLEEGRTAGHTPTKTWMGLKCKLETRNGTEISLEWPDYGGERLTSIVERRTIPEDWRKSIGDARSWMLFIRLSVLNLFEDRMNRPVDNSQKVEIAENYQIERTDWDDRAKYVELLQMLLFSTKQSTFNKIIQPRLAVILSCWDELNETRDPEQVFKSRLPILHAFIQSIWSDKSWSVWGLSSLGRSLDAEIKDDEFARCGPENFGYVIPPGSTEQEPDLTAPVAWLLEV